MSLKDTLADDLKTAMRAGDEVRKSTLRLLLTAITKAEVPSEDDVGAVGCHLRALVGMNRDCTLVG